jgi:hypothetical protein
MGTDEETQDPETRQACVLLALFHDFMTKEGETPQRLAICSNVAALYMSNHHPGAWNKNPVQNARLGIACMTSLLVGYKGAVSLLDQEDRPKDLDFHSFCLGLSFGTAFAEVVRGEIEKIHAATLAAQRSANP